MCLCYLDKSTSSLNLTYASFERSQQSSYGPNNRKVSIVKADAAFVRTYTGFAIGGVAPLAHPAPQTTFIYGDLLQYDEIWAAGGTPNTVFALTSADLQTMTGGIVTTIS